MRDIFTHKITTPKHWYMLMMPTVYTRAELDYDLVVGADTIVTPSYDPHCVPGDPWYVTDGCEPVAVISAEKLRDYTQGKAETSNIANVLLNDDRMGQYVIDPEAWDCIWTELIVNKKGLKTVFDRPGHSEHQYDFSVEMLEEMISQLDRLITKYSSPEWNSKATANRLVQLLVEHRAVVQVELNQVNSGMRQLTGKDYLGPKERARRRKLNLQNAGHGEMNDERDYSKYFLSLEQKVKDKRVAELKELALKSKREEQLAQREARLLEKMKKEASALA